MAGMGYLFRKSVRGLSCPALPCHGQRRGRPSVTTHSEPQNQSVLASTTTGRAGGLLAAYVLLENLPVITPIGGSPGRPLPELKCLQWTPPIKNQGHNGPEPRLSPVWGAGTAEIAPVSDPP